LIQSREGMPSSFIAPFFVKIMKDDGRLAEIGNPPERND
jgi:hypothetical protein